MTLPEPVPPVLVEVLAALSEGDQAILEDRLMARTASGRFVYSAEAVSFALADLGHSIGETSIKRYRRQITRQEVQV